ncbi:MAG: hypothetical protein U0P45_10765 [Acidimicrobiales bacterium]
MLNAGDEMGRSQGGWADGYTSSRPMAACRGPRRTGTRSRGAPKRRACATSRPAPRRNTTWIDPGDEAITWLKADGSPSSTGLTDSPSTPCRCCLPPTAADAALVLILVPHGDVL